MILNYFVTETLLQLSEEEEKKSIEKITRLLLIVENRDIVHRFSEILDNKVPLHTFEYVCY
jgi:hypothetical protein